MEKRKSILPREQSKNTKTDFTGSGRKRQNNRVLGADTKDEVIKMSPKELLYIEDALSHTQFLMNQCREAASRLTDPALRQQAQQLVNGNQKLFTQFFNLV